MIATIVIMSILIVISWNRTKLWELVITERELSLKEIWSRFWLYSLMVLLVIIVFSLISYVLGGVD